MRLRRYTTQEAHHKRRPRSVNSLPPPLRVVRRPRCRPYRSLDRCHKRNLRPTPKVALPYLTLFHRSDAQAFLMLTLADLAVRIIRCHRTTQQCRPLNSTTALRQPRRFSMDKARHGPSNNLLSHQLKAHQIRRCQAVHGLPA